MLRKIVILLFFVFPMFIFSQTEIDVLKLKNGDIIKGKIIENKINQYIRIELQGGSILTYQYNQIQEIERENISEKKSNERSHEPRVIENQAKLDAKEDYGFKFFSSSTTSDEWIAFGGTFLSAFIASPLLGGTIGMGASYSLAGKNPQIPSSRLNSVQYNEYNDEAKRIYDNAYKNEAKNHIKQRALFSSASGCITAWSVLISIITSSDTGY